jgi:hypothetical protein
VPPETTPRFPNSDKAKYISLIGARQESDICDMALSANLPTWPVQKLPYCPIANLRTCRAYMPGVTHTIEAWSRQTGRERRTNMLHSDTGDNAKTNNPGLDNSAHVDWREERRAWRQERREARRRFPFHGMSFGLTLLLLGILFLLNQLGVVNGDRWWQSLLIGLGGISIIDGLVHFVSREYRWRSYGKFVLGIVLIAVGTMFIIGLGQWWSLALIVAGVAMLLRFFWRR